MSIRALRFAWLAGGTIGIGTAGAQATPHHHDPGSEEAADEAMRHHEGAGPHLVTTPPRVATAADSARAVALVAEIRTSAGRYQDPEAAMADGFRPFLPNVKSQRIWHYTKPGNALGERFRFDPAKPTSLLYRTRPDGKLELIGVMYTMPKSATPAELDARVPLSLAAWHRHVHICLPPRGAPERWHETSDGLPLFGPHGTIATEAGCTAASGRFIPQLFGWMVHVNAFSAQGLAAFE